MSRSKIGFFILILVVIFMTTVNFDSPVRGLLVVQDESMDEDQLAFLNPPNPVQLFDGIDAWHHFDVSEDCSKIVYSTQQGEQPRLVVFDSESHETREYVSDFTTSTIGGGALMLPHFNEDATKVVASFATRTSNGDHPYGIVILDLTSGEFNEVYQSDNAQVWFPTWSGNTEILFVLDERLSNDDTYHSLNTLTGDVSLWESDSEEFWDFLSDEGRFFHDIPEDAHVYYQENGLGYKSCGS